MQHALQVCQGMYREVIKRFLLSYMLYIWKLWFRSRIIRWKGIISITDLFPLSFTLKVLVHFHQGPESPCLTFSIVTYIAIKIINPALLTVNGLIISLLNYILMGSLCTLCPLRPVSTELYSILSEPSCRCIAQCIFYVRTVY